MKNKTPLHILAICTFLLLGNVISQAQVKGDFRVTGQKIVIEGDSLSIKMSIKANDLSVRSSDQFQFRITLNGDKRQVELPPVIYSGTSRAKFDKRDKKIYGENPKITPYHSYNNLTRKPRAYDLEYSVRIPYHLWMDTAMIVTKQLFRDCCSETKILEERVLARLNLNPKPQEELWAADPAVYRRMISFTKAPTDTTKSRTEQTTLNIDFQNRRAKMMPKFRDNPKELEKSDILFQRLSGNDIVKFTSIYVTGYGAPDGYFATNDPLIKSRTMSFYDYLLDTYNLPKKDVVFYEWVAEDWDGLLEMLKTSDIESKDEIAEMINSTDNFDLRKKKIKTQRAAYREISKNFFPPLDRMSITVNYRVSQLPDTLAKALLYVYPDFLSLEEIYRVADTYPKGTKEYREAFEIALEQYPDRSITLNNYSAALLYEGNVNGARRFLSKVADQPESYNNVGAYYYILGDFDKAKEYFTKAVEAGYSQGKSNILLLPKKKRKIIETHIQK